MKFFSAQSHRGHELQNGVLYITEGVATAERTCHVGQDSISTLSSLSTRRGWLGVQLHSKPSFLRTVEMLNNPVNLTASGITIQVKCEEARLSTIVRHT